MDKNINWLCELALFGAYSINFCVEHGMNYRCYQGIYLDIEEKLLCENFGA